MDCTIDLLHRHTYLGEACPRPRGWVPPGGTPHEPGFVLVGIVSDGGSDTYWKGSGGLACMIGRPTLGSIYAGETSLL